MRLDTRGINKILVLAFCSFAAGLVHIHSAAGFDGCRRLASELRIQIENALKQGDPEKIAAILVRNGYNNQEAENTARRILESHGTSNIQKIAKRIQSFVTESTHAKNFERIENANSLLKGGRPVKPLGQFPAFVERKNGKVKRIFQVDPTHHNEVEVFNAEGKHIDVQDFNGNSLVTTGKRSVEPNRNFWRR